MLAGGLLLTTALGLAEEDDGDDSGALPVEGVTENESGDTVLQARDLQEGDEGEDVTFLQIRLEDLRYYDGDLTGKYDTKTREAVAAFQQENGLEATGIADIRTQVMISAAQYRTLRYGSTGDDVIDLQTRLAALGYYKGKISGNFLEATQSAVKAFQKANSLNQTGEADQATQEVLYANYAVGKGDAAVETPTPQPELANFLVDESEGGAPMPESPVAYTKTLKSGSSGKLVKQLQERLTELGYYEGPISGNFMKYTVRAVKALQTQNGLESTGVVDEETWNAIFNDRKVVLPNHTPRPTATPEPVPYAITVDVQNQAVTVYGRDENGEYTVVVRQMICSTGTRSNPSPVGDWVLNGRKANWCVFPKWGDYARYWTRINASVAFHSPIYRSVSNTDMKIGSYNKLGQRASHGCIRLKVVDAKWIYDNVPAGVVVSIVEKMPDDQELQWALSHEKGPINEKTCVEKEVVLTPEPDYRADQKPELKKNLQSKSTGEEVYWVQRRLKELGYYDTKCVGIMLNRTIAAVKAFQKDHGFSANGVVDQKLIDAMAEAEPLPKATPTPAPAQ